MTIGFEMFVVAFVVGIGINIWKGYVLSVLWGWYLVPSLKLPAIGVIVAIGMMLMVDLFRKVPLTTERKSQANKSVLEDAFDGAFLGFFVPLLTLGVGYVLKDFVGRW
jgi:hypothetical protein